MKSKVFMKLFWVYLIIVFLYTIVASIFFFVKNNQIVKIQLNNNESMYFNQTIEHIETKLKVALSLVNKYKETEEISLYATDSYRNYYNITRVYSNLVENISAFDSFGFVIDIALQDDDLIISKSGTRMMEKYDQEKGITLAHRQQINSYIASGSSQLHLVGETLDSERGKTVAMVKRETINGNIGIIFYITFLEEYIMPHMELNGNGFALMKNETIINRVTNLNAEFMDRLVSTGSAGEPDYMVYRIKSGILPDLSYAYVSSLSSLQGKQFQLLRDTALVYFVLFFFGIGFSYLAAKKFYKPIRGIVNIMKVEGESDAQDEFSFIQETALRMQASNEKLKQILHDNRLPLKHKFLRDMLTGLVPPERIELELEQHGLHALGNSTTVMILEFVEHSVWNKYLPMLAVQEIKLQFMGIITEQLQEEMACEALEWDYKRYTMFLQEQDIQNLKKRIHHALFQLEADFSIRVVASIGQPADNIHSLYRSFQSAWRLLERRVAVDKRTVLTVEDENLDSEYVFYYSLELERELINYVIQGKAEQVDAILERIFIENLNQQTLSGESFSRLVLAIVATVNRVLQQLNKSEGDFFERGALRDLEWLENLQIPELKERLRGIFHLIMEKQKLFTKETEDGIADELIAFIKQNFQRDISLTDLAEKFNFSPGYISILFRNHVGENFKDYLNMYRVMKAKELLGSNQRLTMNEVGEMVGFNHINTFIRIFKRYEGISPGQYARKRD